MDRAKPHPASPLLVLSIAVMFILRFLAPPVSAGVLLQAFYRNGDAGVPTPAGNNGVDFWWDHLAKQAKGLREVGVTAVWLPPVLKGAGGTNSVGYDPFDDYDLGSKPQRGGLPTRYGTREQLARCVAIFRANGIDVYVDLVENQRSGGSGRDGATFRYLDAFGKPNGGRFPKDAGDFHFNFEHVPQDPNVPGPDISFGSDLAPINGKPKGHCAGGIKAAVGWMTRAIDIQGYRYDDPKGISNDFTRDLFNHGPMAGKFVVGEYFDGNQAKVADWIHNGTGGRCSAFDFPLRFNFLQPMCNNAGFFDMATLDHAGLAGSDPFKAVTFVENHDLDANNPIVRNKAQAYAYILTSEGYPCVFYKDYSTDRGCYGMKATLDNLMWIHEKLASGGTRERFKSHDVFAFERQGGRRLLVGLNNNGNNAPAITVDTGFGANVLLHDYTGHSGDVRTGGDGKATVTIPKNVDGRGYVCYAPAGIGGGFDPPGHRVTQVFEGAIDLDVPPADDERPVRVGRIWSAAGESIRGELRFDAAGWSDSTTITLELLDPAGASLATKVYHKDTPQGDPIVATAGAVGFYEFKIRSEKTPAANPKPGYSLSAKYRAPRTLD